MHMKTVPKEVLVSDQIIVRKIYENKKELRFSNRQLYKSAEVHFHLYTVLLLYCYSTKPLQ